MSNTQLIKIGLESTLMENLVNCSIFYYILFILSPACRFCNLALIDSLGLIDIMRRGKFPFRKRMLHLSVRVALHSPTHEKERQSLLPIKRPDNLLRPGWLKFRISSSIPPEYIVIAWLANLDFQARRFVWSSLSWQPVVVAPPPLPLSPLRLHTNIDGMRLDAVGLIRLLIVLEPSCSLHMLWHIMNSYSITRAKWSQGSKFKKAAVSSGVGSVRE